MGWQRVKLAFLVEQHGKLRRISIGVCDNCSGIHIPAEDANGCEKSGIFTYDEIKKKFGCDSEKEKEIHSPKLISVPSKAQEPKDAVLGGVGKHD